MKNKNETKTNESPQKGKSKSQTGGARARALTKIKNNIRHIYALDDLKESLEAVREKLHIYPLSENELKELDEMNDIQKIIKHRIDKWIKRVFKDKKTAEVIGTHYARYRIGEELKMLKDQIAVAEIRSNRVRSYILTSRYFSFF